MSRGETPKEPLPTEKEKMDIKRRFDLADSFNAVFQNEWKAAYTELLTYMRWRDLECIYSLMRIIRVSFDDNDPV